jgi:acyl carrier protein
MKQDRSLEIQNTVFDVIRYLLCESDRTISLTDYIVRDLNLDEEFILLVEDKLGFKIPVEAWNNVWTVQDTIDVLKKYQP